jgi:hypothetical protein
MAGKLPLLLAGWELPLQLHWPFLSWWATSALLKPFRRRQQRVVDRGVATLATAARPQRKRPQLK